MSAYGNYHTKICPYCNSPHNELELTWKHECDIQVLKNKIDQLKDEKNEALNKLNELNEATTILMGQVEGLLKQQNNICELVKIITPNFPMPKPNMLPNTLKDY